MSAVDVPTPVEGGACGTVDIKEPIVEVEPLTPTELTPATTPEEQSPSTANNMAGKKIFGTEKPDDRARALAATLTLEEQVRHLHFLWWDFLVLSLGCFSRPALPKHGCLNGQRLESSGDLCSDRRCDVTWSLLHRVVGIVFNFADLSRSHY
jgi:hypothetical protein